MDLQLEANSLRQAGQEIAQAELATGQRRLLKLHPELADPNAKADLADWAQKKYGLSREQLSSLKDFNLVSRGVREWKADRAKAAEAKRAERTNAIEGKRKVARDRLEKSGSIFDALEAM